MIKTHSVKANCYIDLTPCGLVKICFPFDEVTNAKLRKIRPKGTYCGKGNGWEFPLAAGKQLREEFDKKFLITDQFSQWLYWHEHSLPSFSSAKDLIKKNDFSLPLLDGRTPLPHQISGAKWLVSKQRALLADDMGLGKTITSLLAAYIVTRSVHASVMVIAPAGLHHHWLKESKAFHMQIDLRSWAAIPSELSELGTLLIVDEAHFAQSINSKRTNALLRLSRHPRLRSIWLLSGTPMKNGQPKQLYPLLAALAHPEAGNQRLFENNFCQTHHSAMSSNYPLINYKNYANLDQLSQLIKPFVLQRKKKLILNLPPKIRKNHQVNLSKKQQRGFDYRINLAIDSYRFRADKIETSSEAEALVLLTSFRQISAEFKLFSVIKLLSQIGYNQPVVLFSNFLKPLYLLKRCLKSTLLTGQQSIKERIAIVEEFQNGNINLLLSTYKTAGYGYTLHKANHIILLDRPWSPGDLDQAEDRCHRLGMNSALFSHWVQLGFADKFVDSIISNKEDNINILFGKRRIEITRKSLPIMINSFITQILNLHN